MTIRLELKPEKSGRTLVEYKGRPLAIGRGSVICSAARILLAGGADPAERLEAWRGGMLSMSGPVGDWAALEVKGQSGTGRPVFGRYAERDQDGRRAPAGSLKLAGGTDAAGKAENAPASVPPAPEGTRYPDDDKEPA